MKKFKLKSAYSISLIGILSAQAIVLAYFESLIPFFQVAPQGIKLGLSNIIVIYAVGTLGPIPGIFIAVIKAFFAGLTRGGIAFVLSLCGGIASVLIMSLLIRLKCFKIGFIGISVAGGVTHNIIQLTVISLFLNINVFIAYLPVIIIFGIIMGVVTGTVFNLISPKLKKQGEKIYFKE